MRRFVLAAALALGSCDHLPPPVVLPPPVRSEWVGSGKLRLAERKGDAPLVGPRVTVEEGDWVLEHGGLVAVISQRTGAVIDFGPRGGRDELVEVEPALFLGFSQSSTTMVSIEPSSPSQLHATLRVIDLPMELHVFYSFDGPMLTIESTARALDAKGEGLPIVLGEVVRFGNVPLWVEGYGVSKWGGVFATSFLARDSLGVAYALSSADGKLYARISAADGPGYYGAARTGERFAVTSTERDLPHRVVRLTTSTRSIGDAIRPFLAKTLTQEEALPAGLPETARVELARCAPEGGKRQPFVPYAPADTAALVPYGCFEARAFAPGRGATTWLPLARAKELALPPSGTVSFRVTDKGKPIPARVQVRGVEGTASPDWGDDPDAGAALNVVHADKGSGVRPVPVGKYRVLADRGFEYGSKEQRIEVKAGERVEVALDIERIVDTKGWISSDLHLHAHPSSDAPQPLLDRVRAVASAGVEVAVATDHNRITDYAPAIAELGLGKELVSVVGDEVTTYNLEFGHFNVFPLEKDSKPLVWEHTTPRSLLEEARIRPPLVGSAIAQINHPRMGGIGYFSLIRLPREGIPDFVKRTPDAPIAGFDTVEIYNGDDYVAIGRVEDVLADWIALHEAGIRLTATGNSDSHKLTFHEAGIPRTYVRVSDDSPERFDPRAFVDALRAGRATVSGGIFLTVEVGGKGMGETVAAGDQTISVHADAPPWVDLDSIEIWVRGRVVHTAKGPFDARPVDVKIARKLASGDFVFAIGRGKKPMDVVFRGNGQPFSFTNPVFVK